MTKKEIENIEIELFLKAIYKRYGYDFRSYARATVKRRVQSILRKSSYKHISELIPNLLYDKLFFKNIILNFSITVSEMFRDPFFYTSLRENVIPYL